MVNEEFNSRFGVLDISKEEVENVGLSSVKKVADISIILTIIVGVAFVGSLIFLLYTFTSEITIATILLGLALIGLTVYCIYLSACRKNPYKHGSALIKKDIKTTQEKSYIPTILGTNKNVYIRSISDYHTVLDFCMPSSRSSQGKLLQSVPAENVTDIDFLGFNNGKCELIFRIDNPKQKIEVTVKGSFNYVSAKMFVGCLQNFKNRGKQ